MTPVQVWYPNPRDEAFLEALAARLRGVADVFRGEAICDVLIEGRPTPEDLDRIREGGAAIVPFAGVPPATLEAMRARPDLTLHNLHHNGPETAETTLALLLGAAKRIPSADRALREGDWTPRYRPEETLRLEGKTALILGMGAIGQRVAGERADTGTRERGVRHHTSEGDEIEVPLGGQGSARVPVLPVKRLRDALSEAHALILALPWTPETDGLIGREELRLLRRPSILVNAARAQIVRERDLYEALREGTLHAAGLDVWYRYPKHPEGVVPGYFEMPPEARSTHPSEMPFHELENVVMSPHRGGASRESEEARAEHLESLIREFAATGRMGNLVDLDAGY
jgi:phosphoglycerate dehydrogenase-like enzyme